MGRTAATSPRSSCRRFIAEVGDADRHARSLTIHYLAPAVEGPAQLTVITERSGRMVSYLSARLPRASG